VTENFRKKKYFTFILNKIKNEFDAN